MDVCLAAIGTAVPQYKQDQKTAAEIVATALSLAGKDRRLLNFVYKSTGIESRHSVMSDFCKRQGEYTFFPNDMSLPFPSTAARMQVYKEHALSLALQAIEDCLQDEIMHAAKNITHVITVSCTGMYAPGLDIEIVEKLKLSPHVKRLCINFMGCYGAFNAIKAAHDICKAEENASVLIVCVELCTIHFQKNDSLDSIFSNAIFADGAAAVVVQRQPLTEIAFRLKGFHCDLLTESRKEMAWHIADNGFDIVLSSYVPQAIENGIPAFIQRMMSRYPSDLSAIDLYAIHPGGAKILKACEQALNITEKENRFAYEVLRRYGNMSSATILFVLNLLWQQAKDYLNQRVFSCAFGPGLTIEAMLLQIEKKPA